MPRSKITVIRERLGLSQAEFAKKLRVQVSTVWRWETGRAKPRLEHADAIRALGRPPTLQAILVTSPEEPEVVSGHARVEAAQADEPALVERVGSNESEKALLAATSEITAAWIAGHQHAVPAEDVTTFVHSLTRALRKE
jgi:transcriptional regulator with XRE-family HTH domain